MTRTGPCECPLCDFEADRTTVYAHLQTSHRKSELSRRLLADEYGETTPLETGDTGSGTAD